MKSFSDVKTKYYNNSNTYHTHSFNDEYEKVTVTMCGGKPHEAVDVKGTFYPSTKELIIFLPADVDINGIFCPEISESVKRLKIVGSSGVSNNVLFADVKYLWQSLKEIEFPPSLRTAGFYYCGIEIENLIFNSRPQFTMTITEDIMGRNVTCRFPETAQDIALAYLRQQLANTEWINIERQNRNLWIVNNILCRFGKDIRIALKRYGAAYTISKIGA